MVMLATIRDGMSAVRSTIERESERNREVRMSYVYKVCIRIPGCDDRVDGTNDVVQDDGDDGGKGGIIGVMCYPNSRTRGYWTDNSEDHVVYTMYR
jgi:hypothetical protein